MAALQQGSPLSCFIFFTESFSPVNKHAVIPFILKILKRTPVPSHYPSALLSISLFLLTVKFLRRVSYTHRFTFLFSFAYKSIAVKFSISPLHWNFSCEVCQEPTPYQIQCSNLIPHHNGFFQQQLKLFVFLSFLKLYLLLASVTLFSLNLSLTSLATSSFFNSFPFLPSKCWGAHGLSPKPSFPDLLSLRWCPQWF